MMKLSWLFLINCAIFVLLLTFIPVIYSRETTQRTNIINNNNHILQNDPIIKLEAPTQRHEKINLTVEADTPLNDPSVHIAITTLDPCSQSLSSKSETDRTLRPIWLLLDSAQSTTSKYIYIPYISWMPEDGYKTNNSNEDVEYSTQQDRDRDADSIKDEGLTWSYVLNYRTLCGIHSIDIRLYAFVDRYNTFIHDITYNPPTSAQHIIPPEVLISSTYWSVSSAYQDGINPIQGYYGLDHTIKQKDSLLYRSNAHDPSLFLALHLWKPTDEPTDYISLVLTYNTQVSPDDPTIHPVSCKPLDITWADLGLVKGALVSPDAPYVTIDIIYTDVKSSNHSIYHDTYVYGLQLSQLRSVCPSGLTTVQHTIENMSFTVQWKSDINPNDLYLSSPLYNPIQTSSNTALISSQSILSTYTDISIHNTLYNIQSNLLSSKSPFIIPYAGNIIKITTTHSSYTSYSLECEMKIDHSKADIVTTTIDSNISSKVLLASTVIDPYMAPKSPSSLTSSNFRISSSSSASSSASLITRTHTYTLNDSLIYDILSSLQDSYMYTTEHAAFSLNISVCYGTITIPNGNNIDNTIDDNQMMTIPITYYHPYHQTLPFSTYYAFVMKTISPIAYISINITDKHYQSMILSESDSRKTDNIMMATPTNNTQDNRVTAQTTQHEIVQSSKNSIILVYSNNDRDIEYKNMQLTSDTSVIYPKYSAFDSSYSVTVLVYSFSTTDFDGMIRVDLSGSCLVRPEDEDRDIFPCSFKLADIMPRLSSRSQPINMYELGNTADAIVVSFRRSFNVGVPYRDIHFYDIKTTSYIVTSPEIIIRGDSSISLCHLDGYSQKLPELGLECTQPIACNDVYVALNECHGNGIVEYDTMLQICNTRCSCSPGYTGPTCQQPTQCYNDYRDLSFCNLHGIITTDNTNTCNDVCTCDQGWSGDACNERITCPSPSSSSTGQQCSGHGYYPSAPYGQCFNQCHCDNGWTGPHCEYALSCDIARIDLPVAGGCPADQVEYIVHDTDTGLCRAMCGCADDGLSQDSLTGQIVSPTSDTPAFQQQRQHIQNEEIDLPSTSVCSGNGIYLAEMIDNTTEPPILSCKNKKCICYPGWYGTKCQHKEVCRDIIEQYEDCNHNGTIDCTINMKLDNNNNNNNKDKNNNNDTLLSWTFLSSHMSNAPRNDQVSYQCTCDNPSLWTGPTCAQSVECENKALALKCGSYGYVSVVNHSNSNNNNPSNNNYIHSTDIDDITLENSTRLEKSTLQNSGLECSAHCTCLYGYTGSLCQTCNIPCHKGQANPKARCQDDLEYTLPCLCPYGYIGKYCQYYQVSTSITIRNRILPSWLVSSIQNKNIHNNNNTMNLFMSILTMKFYQILGFNDNILTNTKDINNEYLYLQNVMNIVDIPISLMSVGYSKCNKNDVLDHHIDEFGHDATNNTTNINVNILEDDVIEIPTALTFRIQTNVGNSIATVSREALAINTRWNELSVGQDARLLSGLINDVLSQFDIQSFGEYNGIYKQCFTYDNDDITITPEIPNFDDDEESQNGDDSDNSIYKVSNSFYTISFIFIISMFLF